MHNFTDHMERFIKNLARGAGAILREGYRTKVSPEIKSWGLDFVTKYDLESNDFLIGKIKRRFPGHGVMSEETPGFKKGKRFWIIDPIDGTFGFVRHVGKFSIPIAYVENNKVLYGVIYDPINNELFYARKGKGAFMNGERISISRKNTEIRGSSGFIWIYSSPDNEENYRRIYKKLFDHLFFPVIFSSEAIHLAEVAMGRIDFAISQGCYPWDQVAAALILKEAGAKVTEMDGAPFRWNSRSIVAANPMLHKKLVDLLNK